MYICSDIWDIILDMKEDMEDAERSKRRYWMSLTHGLFGFKDIGSPGWFQSSIRSRIYCLEIGLVPYTEKIYPYIHLLSHHGHVKPLYQLLNLFVLHESKFNIFKIKWKRNTVIPPFDLQ